MLPFQSQVLDAWLKCQATAQSIIWGYEEDFYSEHPISFGIIAMCHKGIVADL